MITVDASPRNVQVRTLELRESTILVVDDEASGRDLMSALLSSQGYRVKSASDGVSALAIVEAGGVDLVLLDLMMSKMDGVEVCTHLRKRPESALLPVVFTTSLSDRASRIRAKEAGADDFLVKPIDGLELLVRVERLLRVRAAHELVYAERERLMRELSKARTQLAMQEPSTLTPSAMQPPPALLSVVPGIVSLPPSALPPTLTGNGLQTSALSTEELAREQRKRIADLTRNGEQLSADEVRTHLQEILRCAEELERRVAASTTSFPLSHTRSTL